MPTKLYIGNVPQSVSSTELAELFEKYGKVLECDIIKDYAFVVSFFFFFLNNLHSNFESFFCQKKIS